MFSETSQHLQQFLIESMDSSKNFALLLARLSHDDTGYYASGVWNSFNDGGDVKKKEQNC